MVFQINFGNQLNKGVEFNCEQGFFSFRALGASCNF